MPARFDLLHPLGQLWLLGIWVRQTVHLSALDTRRMDRASWWRRWIEALWRLQGKEARATRALAVVITIVPLAAMAATLDALGVLPAGSFSALYLIVIFAFIVTYLNYSLEASTLMVKLVGITLVTLLVVLELVNSLVLGEGSVDEAQVRQVELPAIQAVVETNRLTDLPTQVQYLAAWPATGGLFSSTYRMLVSRVDAATGQPNVNAQTLAAGRQSGQSSGVRGRSGRGGLAGVGWAAGRCGSGKGNSLRIIHHIRQDYHSPGDNGFPLAEFGFSFAKRCIL